MLNTPEEIAKALEDARLEEVAAETGLSYFTVLRYRNRKVKRPSLDTAQRLSRWAQGRKVGGRKAR